MCDYLYRAMSRPVIVLLLVMIFVIVSISMAG